MKAFITDIKRFAVHDGDGIRTTVFFKGCPLKCVWCHNPENLSGKEEIAFFPHKCLICGECVEKCERGAQQIEDGARLFNRGKCDSCGKCVEICPSSALIKYGKYVETDKIVEALLEDLDFYISSNGGITLSGGECLIQSKACREILSAVKSNGIHTAVDTCGNVKREDILNVIDFTDVFLYDIKAITPDTHKKCTGFDNAVILDNLVYIDKMGKKTEIRVPCVPGYNDGEMLLIADFIKSLQNVTGVKILPYHNLSGSKYDALSYKNTMPVITPSPAEIAAVKNLFAKEGINVK